MKKTILVLSPHTDDAEIAAGGTIAKWAVEGHTIIHCAFSSAVISLPAGTDENATEREFANAQTILFTDGHVLDFETRTVPQYRQQILEAIVEEGRLYEPDLVVGPSVHDCHQDHRVVAEEMTRAFRRTAAIMSYEHPRNDRGFTPHGWSELSQFDVEAKVAAIQAYKSQLHKPHSFMDRDSILAVLRYRGMQINTTYAEAFEIVRQRI